MHDDSVVTDTDQPTAERLTDLSSTPTPRPEAAQHRPLSPDLAVAERFIETLTGAADTRLFTRVLADPKGLRESSHGKKHHNKEFKVSLRTAFPTVSLFNEKRQCGVFFLVNASDLSQRAEKTAITGLRSLFIDDDDDCIDPAKDLLLPPSIVVRSKRGIHAYWCLVPGETIDSFEPAQRVLCTKYGTDDAVCNVNRLMRLPGFLRMKDPANPTFVELEQAHPERRYTIEQVMRAHGAWPLQVVPRSKPWRSAENPRRAERSVLGEISQVDVSGDSPQRIRKMLDNLRSHPVIRYAGDHPNGVSRKLWMGLALNLAAAVKDATPADELEAENIFHELSKGYRKSVENRYSRRETHQMFVEMLASVRDGRCGPMTYQTMVSAGLPEKLLDGASATALVNDFRLPQFPVRPRGR